VSRAVRTIATVCLCMVASSVFYYFVIFLPLEKRAERADAAKRSETVRSYLREMQNRYANCLKEARQAYVSDWDETCRFNKQPPNCPLLRPHSARLDTLKKEKEERCLRELEALVPK
jgi:hypothetical protein